MNLKACRVVAVLALAPTLFGCHLGEGIENKAQVMSGCSVGLDYPPLGSQKGVFKDMALAQSFSLTSAKSISSILVRMAAVYPAQEFVGGAVGVEIENDNAGMPSGSPIAGTFSSMDADHITTQSSLYKFNFSSQVALQAKRTYWVVMTATYTQNTTHYVSWVGVNSNNGPGKALYYDPTTRNWTNKDIGTNRKFAFGIGCQ